jgi:hypothetical protein
MSQYYLAAICADLDNIKMDLRDIGWGGMDGSIWLRIETSEGLL